MALQIDKRLRAVSASNARLSKELSDLRKQISALSTREAELIAEKNANTLEREKVRWGFWQAVWTTLITGGVAVAIPNAVGAYKAGIEKEIKQAELQLKSLEVHQSHISKFIDTGLDQNIERRLRFTEYFAFVSDAGQKAGWSDFNKNLQQRRDEGRVRIKALEKELRSLKIKEEKSQAEIDEMASVERDLEWIYAEIGYQRKDTDVIRPSVTRVVPEIKYWQTKAIPVCWEENLPEYKPYQDQVQRIVTSTWGVASTLSFVGWGHCKLDSRGVRVTLTAKRPSGGFGQALDGVKNGVKLVFPDGLEGCEDSKRNSCVTKAAIHVWGHVVGLEHEHERPDVPPDCKLGMGMHSGKLLGPYDPQSVMNYCNTSDYNQLSALDKLKIQSIYGVPVE